MVDPRQDVEQERSADYQAYTVSGSRREVGRELAARFPAIGPPAASLHPDHLAFARACRDVVARFYPPLVEEIDAYAEASGRISEDILWHYAPAVGAPGTQCSSVGVMTPEGPVVARNYDFFYWENPRHLVTTRPDDGLAHVGMWAGLAGGRYDGVNAAGLWVALHGGGTRRGKAVPGISFHHVVRILLDVCRTAREAVDMVLQFPHVAPYNYFIADAREMFVVEAHPERVRVREAEDGVLVCTNHPIHPDMVDLTASPILENSRARMEFLLAAARQARNASDPVTVLMTAMQDHTIPVCGHTDGLATFWSAICFPGRRKVAYTRGAPCRNEYVPVAWPGGTQGS